MRKRVLKRHEGFTLIEIIVTLIIVSILGAMLVTMTGNLLHHSTQPAVQAMEIHVMNQVADNIARAYRALGSTSTLQSEIGSGNFNIQGISVTAAATGFGAGAAPVEDGSSDLLKVMITGSTGLTYTVLFANIEI